MNNLGKILSLQKEYKLSDAEIGKAIGYSDEGWRKIRKKYEDNSGAYDYQFTYAQISALRKVLPMLTDSELSPEDMVVHPNEAMIFDEEEEFQALLRDARKRDAALVTDVLRCIALGEENDFPILGQTVNLLVRQPGLYDNRQSLMLLGMIRNAVTQNIRKLFDDDESLRQFCEGFNESIEKSERESFYEKYMKKCLGESRSEQSTNLEKLDIEEKELEKRRLDLKKQLGEGSSTQTDAQNIEMAFESLLTKKQTLNNQIVKDADQKFQQTKEVAFKAYARDQKEIHQEKIRLTQEKIIVDRISQKVHESIQLSLRNGVHAYLRGKL